MGFIILLLIGGVVFLICKHEEHRDPGNNAPARNAAPAAIPGIIRQETGDMIYFADNPHGIPDKEYRFKYRYMNGTWRAYIKKMPSYNGRNINNVPHRLTDGVNPYICWSGGVNSLEKIQIVSRVWANHAQEYLATGKIF